MEVFYDILKPKKDLMPPQTELPKNCQFIKGNLLDESMMDEAMRGVNLVFHTASAGMSGTGQLDEDWFN